MSSIQKQLPGFNDLFTSEEAEAKCQAKLRVILNEEYRDDKDRIWPKGVIGLILAKIETEDGFVLNILMFPPIPENTPRDALFPPKWVIFRSKSLFKRIFSEDHS